MARVSGMAYDQATKEKVVLVIGNTGGIATVDDQMTVEHVQPEAQFHTVVSGDTLGKIAKNYYGNAMAYPTIFEANKPMLTDPDKIYPGQVLRYTCFRLILRIANLKSQRNALAFLFFGIYYVLF